MSLESQFSVAQFQKFTKVIHELGARVIEVHETHLLELNQVDSRQDVGSSGEGLDFNTLVKGGHQEVCWGGGLF